MILAEVKYDHLIANADEQVKTQVVELDKTANESKRGTLLGFEEAGGKLFPLGTNEKTLTPCAILAEDANNETVVLAYVKGTFNKDLIITENSYEIKASDEDTLRKYDIYLVGQGY